MAKKGGLGLDADEIGAGKSALFKTPGQAPAEPQPEQAAAPAESGKRRTSVAFDPHTFALLEALKIHARKYGQPATYGDIVAEAIQDLARKKGVNV